MRQAPVRLLAGIAVEPARAYTGSWLASRPSFFTVRSTACPRDFAGRLCSAISRA